MKIHFLPILACVAILSAACKSSEPDPVPVSAEQFVGLWGFSTDETPAADGIYTEYLRYKPDNTMEYYYIGDSIFAYYRGSYRAENGKLLTVIERFRNFVITQEVPRYIKDCSESLYWTRSAFTVASIGESSITFRASDYNYYFHSVTQLPSTWNAEFSAPEQTPTTANMSGNWDRVSIYQLTTGNSIWWYLYEPEKAGIALLDDSKIAGGGFWANILWERLRATGALAEDEDIFVYHDDCSWQLNADTLKLTCAKLVVQKKDDSDNVLSERNVVPDSPLYVKFLVRSLTPYYLVLYDVGTGFNHAFHRHQQAEGAPQRQDAFTIGKDGHSSTPGNRANGNNWKISALFL